MILPELNVLTPMSLTEALQMRVAYPEAAPLAGGTDLLVLLKQRLVETGTLIDLGRLPELKTFGVVGQELIIGAGVTLAEVGESDFTNGNFPALAEAARSVASPNLRNMATLGGNLCLAPRCLYYNQSQFWRSTLGNCRKTGGNECFAVPGSRRCYACFSADCPPALIALSATVTVARWSDGVTEERRFPLEDFYRNDGEKPLTLAADEIVTTIQLPMRKEVLSAYRKYRRRAAIDFPLSGVALAFRIADGRVKNIRIVLNALASAPVLAREAMDLLEGKPFSAGIIEEAMAGLTHGTHPVRNQAGSPEHRRQMARLLFRQAAEKLVTL